MNGVDLVACGDEDGTSSCGRRPGFFLRMSLENGPIMIAYSVLIAVWAGSSDPTILTFAPSAKGAVRLNVWCWCASLGRPMGSHARKP